MEMAHIKLDYPGTICWKYVGFSCCQGNVKVVFMSKLKTVIDLGHLDCTFRASQGEDEETRKPCLFLPFFMLNLDIGMCNLEAKENSSSLKT